MGRALMAKPIPVLLDELSLGFAPLLMREIFEITRTINAERGTTPLLVEQSAQSGRQAPRQRRRPRVLPGPERSQPPDELQGPEILQALQALGVLTPPPPARRPPLDGDVT